ANILNYAEVGYFDLPATAKPLLHLWSLGVEEQFYIVFPALLLLLWRYRAMSSWLALIGLASFALNIALVRGHLSFTFYLPLTRFWEFIAGACMAARSLYRCIPLRHFRCAMFPQQSGCCSSLPALVLPARMPSLAGGPCCPCWGR